MTDTPDARSTAVLRRGTAYGFKGKIPVGGHVQPSSGVGARLLWKKAQKKEKKKATSEVINRIIPKRRPVETGVVWWPMKVLSRMTSRHHWSIVRLVIIRPNRRHVSSWLWNHAVRPMVREKAPAAAVSGHGLNSTRWNGWRIM